MVSIAFENNIAFYFFLIIIGAFTFESEFGRILTDYPKYLKTSLHPMTLNFP